MENILEIVPDIWRGSEKSVFLMLNKGKLDNFSTIICIRRKEPDWWSSAIKNNHNVNFMHYPIAPSNNTNCAKEIWGFFEDILPMLKKPILIFCKEGRNRTGIISALIKFSCLFSTEGAIQEYLIGVGNQPREVELFIIKNLCVKIKNV